VLLGITTQNAVALGVIAGVFVVFALASALLVPLRWPEFPGEHLRWFVVATLVLLVATLGAVEVFAVEPKEEVAAGETTTEHEPPPPGATTGEPPPPPGATTGAEPPPPPPPASAGDAATGRGIFTGQGCGNCHAFSAAGTSGAVGPNLDESLQGEDTAFIRESIVEPNEETAEGYQPNVMPDIYDQELTPKQLDDLVAFLEEG
jgi:mono/diheme cytochrome c family protein